VILPHDLVAALVKNGLWPLQLGAVTSQDVKEWWGHMVKNTTWFAEHPGSQEQKHEPLFLYGDDACMTKAGNEKMTVVTLNHSLDTRKSSRKTSWPLFIFRCVPCTHSFSYGPCKLLVRIYLYVRNSAALQALSLGYDTLQAYMAPVSQLHMSTAYTYIYIQVFWYVHNVEDISSSPFKNHCLGHREFEPSFLWLSARETSQRVHS
jgi:hypothetical protein